MKMSEAFAKLGVKVVYDPFLALRADALGLDDIRGVNLREDVKSINIETVVCHTEGFQPEVAVSRDSWDLAGRVAHEIAEYCNAEYHREDKKFAHDETMLMHYENYIQKIVEILVAEVEGIEVEDCFGMYERHIKEFRQTEEPITGRIHHAERRAANG